MGGQGRLPTITAALAMAVTIGTITFGASLVSHPALYGWNWNYKLNADGVGDIPAHQAAVLLGHDHYASWVPYYFGTT
jgi:hypothetical protein